MTAPRRRGWAFRRRRLTSTLYDAFGQAQVSTMYSSLNQYHVVMEAAPQFWQGPQGLDGIYLHATNSSAMVPLSAVAHYEPTTAPIAVNHQGQFPVRHALVQSRAGHWP